MLVVISPLSLEICEAFYMETQACFTPSSGVTHLCYRVQASVVKSVLWVVPHAQCVSVYWYSTPSVAQEVFRFQCNNVKIHHKCKSCKNLYILYHQLNVLWSLVVQSSGSQFVNMSNGVEEKFWHTKLDFFFLLFFKPWTVNEIKQHEKFRGEMSL